MGDIVLVNDGTFLGNSFIRLKSNLRVSVRAVGLRLSIGIWSG